MLSNTINLFLPLRDRSKSQNFYLIFGEQGLRDLVDHFYDIMATDPKAKECLELHALVDGKVQAESQYKLFAFLCGWMGGPQLFVNEFGPPRMRARHGHVKITAKEKEQWLYCMKKSLKRAPLSYRERKKVFQSFVALAMRIQNH
jgi:hemoglobin